MGKNRIECVPLFFSEISDWLQNAELREGRENYDYKRISGVVVTPLCSARIDILFRPSHLKSSVPIVFCNEEWIRRDLDWHCFRSSSGPEAWKTSDRLCWIHYLEWIRAQNHQMKRLPLVVEEGSEWLKNNVSKLLDRHWTGHVLGLKKWKSEWGGWGHGQFGTDQFLSELAKDGHPTNWEVIPQSSL